jgi:hypothetical protein
MQNHPFRNRTPGAARNRPPGTSKAVHSRKKSLATFLTETEIWPLVLAGRCVDQFGWGIVVGFVLGAVLVYGYAVFRILPGSKAAVAPPEHVAIVDPPAPKKIRLYGTAKSHEAKYEIGMLISPRLGPFNPGDVYTLQVPESDHYVVVGWNPNYENFAMQEMFPDASGRLQELVFPNSSTSKREGPVKKQTDGASDNYALAENRKSQVKDGAVAIKNALMGGSK